MAEPQSQQTKPATPEFLLDDADQLTPEEQAGLDSEQVEPEPEPTTLPAKPSTQPPQQAADKKPSKPTEELSLQERFGGAIKKERERNKALEAELAQERERIARLDERARMARELEERAAAQQRQQTQEIPSKLGAKPDASIDPIGADLWDVRRENELLRHEQAQTRQAVGATDQQLQANRQQQEFANWVNNDAAQFRAQHADYDQAANHAYEFRVNYWKDLGLPEAQARQIVDQEAVATAMVARQSGKSPSAQFYELAKRVGYQAQGTETQALQPEVQPSPTQAARERLNQVRNGQKFQGLSRVPAERAENVDWSNLDAQAIADIPEEDFTADLNDPVKGPQLRKALARLELGQ
jgi:hypothetical protein